MAVHQKSVNETIDHFRTASSANIEAPGRCGNIVNLTPEDAEDVIVSADLHGNRLNFAKLVRNAALARHPQRHLVMQEVCHGGPTYPSSKACMSHQLLEDVAKLKCQFPTQFHFLLGNHELAEMTDFLILKRGRVLNLLFREGLQTMYGDASETVRHAAVDFLHSCPLAVRINDRILVTHSIPAGVDEIGFDRSIFQKTYNPLDLARGGGVFRLLWGRDYRPENALAFARLMDADILLQGHQPCPDGFLIPNRYQIVLDCCNERATFLQWRLDESLNHEQLTRCIRRLANGQPVCEETSA